MLIIGIFDLLARANTAIIDSAWQLVQCRDRPVRGGDLFRLCLAMSRDNRRLEAQVPQAKICPIED